MSFDEQSQQDVEETELNLESNHEEKQDTHTNSEERENSMDDEEKHEEKLGLLEGDVGGPQTVIKCEKKSRCSFPCCIIISLGLVILLCIIAVAASLSVIVHPTAKSNESLKKVTLDDVFNSSFSTQSYSGAWTSRGELLHISREEGVVLFSPITNTSNVIITPSTMEAYNVSTVTLSSNGDYAMLISNTEKVYRHSFLADYYIHNITNNITNSLIMGETWNRVQYAVWSPTQNIVAYVRGNNIFTYNVLSNTTCQYTFDGEENVIYNGIPDWVYEEEVLSTNYALWWSPDSTHIIYLKFDDNNVDSFQFPIYGGYTKQYTHIESIAYPKAGTTNPIATAWVFNTVGNHTDLELLIPQSFQDQHYIVYAGWANETTPMISWMNRTQNIMIYCLYTTSNGECKTLYEQRSDAWIELVQPPIFIDGGNKMLLIDSVADNNDSYLHIVQVATTSVQMTHGEWEVTSILGANDDIILYISTGNNSWQRHIYNVGGSCLTCQQEQWEILDSQSECQYWSGDCNGNLSYCVLYCSGPCVPFSVLVKYEDNTFIPVSYLERNIELQNIMQSFDLPFIEEIEIPADNDLPYSLYSRVMFPPGGSKNCKYSYPVLFYVYGGPYSQMIGQYAVTSRLFPMYLSSKLNMIVISVDGRGTGFRGDNFKHAVYRKLGLLETSDQIRAVRYFQKQCYTISQHFAIYGSSYGGYMAGMVGSSGSGVFSTAISQSPVTDWRYYDSIYTERYMGLPSYDDNFEGYENSSLLLRAANLSSVNYMLLHGTSDDNVHFQNTAQLVEVLTKNDIQFRLQFYTDQTHSLSDTRSHLYHLITEFLEESFEK